MYQPDCQLIVAWAMQHKGDKVRYVPYKQGEERYADSSELSRDALEITV